MASNHLEVEPCSWYFISSSFMVINNVRNREREREGDRYKERQRLSGSESVLKNYMDCASLYKDELRSTRNNFYEEVLPSLLSTNLC